MKEKKEDRQRERTGRNERETDSGVKFYSYLARPLTSAYAYQCGLKERAHPASRGPAITLHF